jgi:hypothetical protein
MTESEADAATVEQVAARIDEALRDSSGAEVREVVDVAEEGDGAVIVLEVAEFPDEDDEGLTHVAVHVDDDGEIQDLELAEERTEDDEET